MEGGEEFLEGGEFPQISSSILFYDIKFARNQESEQKQSVFPGERSDFWTPNWSLQLDSIIWGAQKPRNVG